MNRIARALTAFVVALGLIGEARATTPIIYYQGGEQPDFNCTGTCSTSVASISFRANYARMSIGTTANATDPPASRIKTAAFTGVSSLWIHGQILASNVTTSSGMQFMRIMDSAGNATLTVRGTGTNSQVKVSSRTSAGAFTDLVTCSSAFDNTPSITQIDLFIDYQASGTVTLYKNSVSVCTFSGDNRNGDGATTITGVEFANLGAGLATNWSEVIVSDSDTRTMSRFTMNTATGGNATTWSNSAGSTPCSTSILAQTAQNDANYVNTNSTGTIEQCVPNTSFPTGMWNVIALGVGVRGLIGAGGPQNLSIMTRESGTDYTLIPTIPFTSTFSTVPNFLQTTDPAGGAWAVSTFTTAGFNIGFKSAP